jgi:hypothetical protein
MSLLPAEYHAAVTASVAGTWLPIDVAVQHYNACDRLALGTLDILSIAQDVTKRVHGTALRTFLTLAQGLGMTPWTALDHAATLWRRCWEGGDVSVVRLGPKEARVEIAGWPCASTAYCRVACRGIITSIIEPFCVKAYVREESALCGRLTLGYVASWA